MSPEQIIKVVTGVLTLGVKPTLEWLEKRKAARERKALEAQVSNPLEPELRLLLIVEDNANDVELLEYFLRQASNANVGKYGVEVEVATNTQDAWTSYIQRHHHIVLLDMRFPTGEQGWSLAERMRRHDVRTQIVIMFTIAEDVNKLPAGQIFSMMKKPPTYEGILQLLAKLR